MESFIKLVYGVYGLQKSNSVSAPGVKTPALPTSVEEPWHFSDHKRFRTVIGKLQWMAAVRPDIQFAVKELSCPVSRKSTTRVICQLWGASVVHASRTRATIAQSSAEAEVYALTSAASDPIQLQSVIIEMEKPSQLKDQASLAYRLSLRQCYGQ
eukprot:2329880-Amphidinium_carterae.1